MIYTDVLFLVVLSKETEGGREGKKGREEGGRHLILVLVLTILNAENKYHVSYLTLLNLDPHI